MEPTNGVLFPIPAALLHLTPMTTSWTTTERYPPIELASGNKTRAVRFSADGEYLVSGDEKRVRVWRVEDGKQVATMAAGLVNCLAVSKDGRLIAAGTFSGEVIVWDALRGYKRIFALEDHYVIGLDFSPNSPTRLLTASFDCTVTVWDVVNRERALTLRWHDEEILAAKYSPQGDRIAVATGKFIRVYDMDGSGRLLVEIKAEVTPWYNTGLLWSNDWFFIVSENKIKQIDVSTGSIVSEWPVPDSDASTCIALQQHGDFLAYSTNRTVTIWDTYDTHTQLDLIQHSQIIRSIAISPDDRFLAIAGERGKITIRRLPRSLTDMIPLSRLHPTFQEPDFQVHDAALQSWKQGQLANADALLTAAISTSPNASHHILASRALVRTRLGDWDAAIVDAKESIKIQPSVVGYIAKSVAHVGKGEEHIGYRACDIAFERFHSNHVSFLLLIKAVIVFMAGAHDDAISRLDDLIATVRSNSICYVVQAKMYLLLGKSYMEHRNYKDAILSFERALAKVRRHTSLPLSAVSLISGWIFDDLDVKIRQCLCEAMFTAGRAKDARESLLKLVKTIEKEVYVIGPTTEWICDFIQRCLSTPESDGDASSNIAQHGNLPLPHPTPNSSTHVPILRVWTKEKLTHNGWEDALAASVGFLIPRFDVYQAVCEHLEAADRVFDATECFRQMVGEVTVETHMHEQVKWVVDFKLRCAEKLEHLGDAAMTTRDYDEAISRYSAALALNPGVPQGLFIKRSKAYIAGGVWEQALNDADEVIILDPSSPWGYERKHAALHKAGCYDEAIGTFKTMLSKISESLDPEIRACSQQYVDPAETEEAIRGVVQNAIRDSPRVLIHTNSGRLLDKTEQALSFESLLVFKELISSTTTHIDHDHIEHEVTEYYRYATFSHTWERNEPMFEKVVRIVVYDLEKYPTHDKLQMFCKIARDSGFRWAWSDTCCINKGDHGVLQEALVAMFKWYEGSALTIVILRGVRSPSQRGDLVKSIWNTRAWTFQEYHASKVVRFYTEDWTPYLNLDIHNHKESPEIISEMQEATGISARALMALRPGLDDIREKLCLASTRKTTFVEDAAYSLLGIFSMSLPVVYGEGDQSLGRLLAQLLTSSGNTSILAWTGKSGGFNSCLPAKIAVFKKPTTTHIPQAISDTDMDRITATLQASSLSLSSAMKLYDRIRELRVPRFAGQRMELPCLTFTLGPVSATQSTLGCVFQAKVDALGTVEIRTSEDLSRLDSLTLVHPWVDFLLDRRPIGGITDLIPEEEAQHQSSIASSSSSSVASSAAPSYSQRRQSMMNRIWRLGSLSTPSRDKQTQALQLMARLRQPFGALLFKQTRQHLAEYKRVAADSSITVRIKDDTSLEMLIDSVRILDVL